VDYITCFCFQYDPATGKYTLAITNILKIAGSLTVLLLAGFIIIFIRSDKNRSPKDKWKELHHVG
jgi:protein SCO1/2